MGVGGEFLARRLGIGGQLMSTLGWLLVVAIGIALGFSAARLWPGAGTRITELERERDAAREALRHYRQDVNEHFARTAQLFDKVTGDYRRLYEHLATGSRQLTAIPAEAADTALEEPERRRLARDAAAAGPPAPAAESALQVEQPSPDDPGPELADAAAPEAGPKTGEKLKVVR
jgi:uncharacterized protein